MGRFLKRRWLRDLGWLLLIVCVAVMAAPILSQRQARRYLASCQVNVKNIGTALEMYSTDNGGALPGG